jgi:hypothetical protein
MQDLSTFSPPIYIKQVKIIRRTCDFRVFSFKIEAPVEAAMLIALLPPLGPLEIWQLIYNK